MLDLLKKAKIDLKKTIIIFDSGTSLDYDFQISPREFLNFAKTDIGENNRKGKINALTNAKRAIDCQIDKVLFALSLDPKNLPSSFTDFLADFDQQLLPKDLTIKLKFIHVMNFAPTGIVSRTRTLRNKLEHNYEEPQLNEVEDAIELSELFIMAIESKLFPVCDFHITDSNNNTEDYSKNNIKVCVGSDNEIEIRNYFENVNRPNFKIGNDMKEYYHLIKLCSLNNHHIEFKESFSDFLKMLNHPIPARNINVEFE